MPMTTNPQIIVTPVKYALGPMIRASMIEIGWKVVYVVKKTRLIIDFIEINVRVDIPDTFVQVGNEFQGVQNLPIQMTYITVPNVAQIFCHASNGGGR